MKVGSVPGCWCQVCGAELLLESAVRCPACETPHHADCWEYLGRCSTYGCYRPPRPAAEVVPGTVFSLELPLPTLADQPGRGIEWLADQNELVPSLERETEFRLFGQIADVLRTWTIRAGQMVHGSRGTLPELPEDTMAVELPEAMRPAVLAAEPYGYPLHVPARGVWLVRTKGQLYVGTPRGLLASFRSGPVPLSLVGPLFGPRRVALMPMQEVKDASITYSLSLEWTSCDAFPITAPIALAGDRTAFLRRLNQACQLGAAVASCLGLRYEEHLLDRKSGPPASDQG